jgi:hypothetical protein
LFVELYILRFVEGEAQVMMAPLFTKLSIVGAMVF